MTTDIASDLISGELVPNLDGIEIPSRSNVPKDYDTSQLLSLSFQEREFVLAFADSVSNLLDQLIERQRRALYLSRDPTFLSRSLKILVTKMLGLEYNSDVLTDDDYDRLILFLGIYNRQKGPDHFINFLGYIKDLDLSMHKLWTEDYVDFRLNKPQSALDIFSNGTWYQTTHVGLLYPDLGGIDNLDPRDIENLFYKLAPINLVLKWIASQTILDLTTLLIGTNIVETDYFSFITTNNLTTDLIITTNAVETDYFLFRT